jgi:predicted metal-binding protein
MEYAMDSLQRRPVARPSYAVAQSAPHQISVCKACKHPRSGYEVGLALLEELRPAIATADSSDHFEASFFARLVRCAPYHRGQYVVGWQANAQATWLSGDVDLAHPLDEIVEFSRLYAALDDGWLAGHNCPQRLAANTPARIPAAIIATREGAIH